MDKRNTYGFTLVEVLAVLTIMGLMAAVVILNIPTRKDDAVKDYGDTLLLSLNRTAQESLLTGQVHAFEPMRDGYRFSVFDGEVWQAGAEINWPDNSRIIFTKETARIDLPKTYTPLILFEPTGGNTPFTLSLQSRDKSYRLASTGDGRVFQDRAQ